jgi:hypothetical protein
LRLQDDHEYVRNGPLEVRVVRDGETATVALSGEFDLATLREAEAGLEKARRDDARRIVVDAEDRLTFIPSEFPGVRRVLGVTGVDGILGGEAADEAPV